MSGNDVPPNITDCGNTRPNRTGLLAKQPGPMAMGLFVVNILSGDKSQLLIVLFPDLIPKAKALGYQPVPFKTWTDSELP